MIQSFGSQNRVIPRTSVQEVAAQPAEDDVICKWSLVGVVGEFVIRRIPICIVAERGHVDDLLQLAGGIDHRVLNRSRRADGLLGRRCQVVERFRRAVAVSNH